ncbi:Crp/Fnr family transcriptional regulator [Rhodobium gokarnense]|uniref:CRP-like cAMP-binding protein n=1 Tax=Rhodobium gokarnense TaxID=364296 RepID=A0ABT3H8Q3_9HYPH|nr:cyclic nucleotide-binding domain-containing protein [Rhodobium gokarnense]MCW2306771.1 CRP-like cAMP-binding protein [Rhodobium gokarnense]
MTLEEDIDLFRQVPLLADFTDEQLRLLAFGSEDRVLAAGTVLFEAGDRGSTAYLVGSGRIELRSADDRQLLAMVKPGTLIGETALMTETVCQNRAVAGEETEIVQIRRSLFRRILREYPDLAVRIYQAYADRLKGTIRDLNRVRDSLVAIDPEAGEPFTDSLGEDG